jgi:hypothetical protein
VGFYFNTSTNLQNTCGKFWTKTFELVIVSFIQDTTIFFRQQGYSNTSNNDCNNITDTMKDSPNANVGVAAEGLVGREMWVKSQHACEG